MNPRQLLLAATAACSLAIATTAAAAEAAVDLLAEAATGAHRSDANIARNEYRNPIATLLWFGLEPDMTVVEIWPGGGGWYTEVLAPVLRKHGKLVAANYGPAADVAYYARNMRKYKTKLQAMSAVYDKVTVTELMPPQKKQATAPGSADMVVTFRNLHNWLERGIAADMFAAMYEALKPGGVMGLVAHRAAPGTPDRPKAGYVTEATAVRLAQDAGFDYVDRSEINANPLDTRDHPEGVWTLPPSYRGDHDRSHYAAIGESDRMTLKFRKPAGE